MTGTKVVELPPISGPSSSAFNSAEAVIIINPISEESYHEDSTALESAYDYHRLPEEERRFERVVSGLRLGLRN